MIKIATPLSHLFKDPTDATAIQNASDVLEVRDHSLEIKNGPQTLFHCELQVIHSWENKEWDYLKKVKDQKTDLELLSFHVASCYTQPHIENGMFQAGGELLSPDQMQQHAVDNFKGLRALFGDDKTYAVENNNYYPTPAYAHITEGQFISQVVENNQLRFLFDMAHAKVTAHNQNISLEGYQASLPLDRLIQVHVAKPDVNSEGIAFDAHLLPGPDEMNELGKLLDAYPGIEYVTMEYYTDAPNLLILLKQLKQIIHELSGETL